MLSPDTQGAAYRIGLAMIDWLFEVGLAATALIWNIN
jgi:hypothetical protein